MKAGNGKFQAAAVIGSMVAGSGLMYLLDPRRGAGRRSLLKDKAASALRTAASASDKAARDLRNRAEGSVAGLWSRVRPSEVSDEKLQERIRSKIGSGVSHPSSIEVAANNGVVRLSGPILKGEAEWLIPMVRSVSGVQDVEDRLEIHEEPGDVPGLQGGKQVRRPRFELAQTTWAPGPRVLVGAAGAAAVALAWKRPVWGIPVAVSGAAMLLRAASNRPLRKALGLTRDCKGISVQKAIEVEAPVDGVFKIWSDLESFPRIMAHVREVKKSDGLYHWTIGGPAGMSVSWDAEITEYVPGKVIAWRSVPGSLLRNAGTVRFEGTPDGGTRIDVRISYNPPGGELGRAFAYLLGAHPKHLLDDDMARFKSSVEKREGEQGVEQGEQGEQRRIAAQGRKTTAGDAGRVPGSPLETDMT
jgi:uncharacterized membrane protein/osmotically-inducible protein OsmY